MKGRRGPKQHLKFKMVNGCISLLAILRVYLTFSGMVSAHSKVGWLVGWKDLLLDQGSPGRYVEVLIFLTCSPGTLSNLFLMAVSIG